MAVRDYECGSLMRQEDEEQLERVVALVGDVLGENVVGAYLFGSAVLGGLRRSSDLDVLVVAKRPTTREERQRLVDRLLVISGRVGRRVELTIVVESDVRPWRYPPRLDFQYGDWLRAEFARGNLDPCPMEKPDLASLITQALLADRPILGPAPAAVLDPVPHADLLRGILDGVDESLGVLDSDTTNAILTLARAWSTVATGAIRSKDAAAHWALARLPAEHRPVLDRARRIYLGEEEERWDDLRADVPRYAEYAAGRARVSC
jgi:predicted nucleotidyltransferase